jgi:hypothetical protein
MERAQKMADELSPAANALQFPARDGGTISATALKPRREFARIGIEQSDLSIFNDLNNSQPKIVDREELKNHLIYVSSSLGSHYYLNSTPAIGYYGGERDFFFPDRKMAALGRYLVFRVNKPSPSVRLSLSVSSSFLGSNTALPPAFVAGETVVDLGLRGRGSARVISAPFKPLAAGGAYYIVVDLGRDADAMATPRSGLMGLYGSTIQIDYRRVVTFGRRIKLLDGDAFDPKDRPSGLRSFPRDLADERLEYSGIYEDGWLSAAGYVVLAGETDTRRLKVRGSLPKGIGLDSVEATIQVNGAEFHKKLTPGPFEIEVPAGAGPQRIDFLFSNVGRLPGNEARPVSAQLLSMALEK